MSRTTRWLVPSLLLAWPAVGFSQPPPGGRDSSSLTLPENVRVEKDIPYARTENPRQTLDLLLPRAPKGGKPLPLVVNIHGGAFRAGDKSMGVREIAGLVDDGDYAAATINYRLSGEATWPAQIHDCKAAIRWLRANAPKYGIDPDRIGVIGASAGGHLAALLGTSGGIATLEGDLGTHAGVSSRVKCVVDQFGPSDLLAMGDYPSRIDHNAPESPESKLIGGGAPGAQGRRAGGLADHVCLSRRPAVPDLPRDRGPAGPLQPVGTPGRGAQGRGCLVYLRQCR